MHELRARGRLGDDPDLCHKGAAVSAGWRFELRGWWQIALFELAIAVVIVVAYWCGYMDGSKR